MAIPSRRDPAMQPLRDVRMGLLRLHKALIDSERAIYESQHGQMTPGQFLTALLEEPYFAWLRPYSGLIVEIDEALAAEDPPGPGDARALVGRAHALAGEEPGERLAHARHRDPGVLFAHTGFTRAVAAALVAYQER